MAKRSRPRHPDKDIEAAVRHKVHSFRLVYTGADDLTRELLDALYEAGCDDSTVGLSNGQLNLDFDREAASYQEALSSAIADVTRANQPIRLVRVEPL